MKHNKMVLANAFAVTLGAVYLVCYFLAFLAPDFLMGLSSSWVHLINLEQIRVPMVLDPIRLVYGLVTSAVGGWLFGFVLGTAIEYFESR